MSETLVYELKNTLFHSGRIPIMVATPILSQPALKIQKLLFVSHRAKDRERIMRESLAAEGIWQVETVSEKFAFVNQLLTQRPDLVIADAETPCFKPLEALYLVKKILPHSRFYLLLDTGNEERLLDAVLHGADACFFRNQWNTVRNIIDFPMSGPEEKELSDMKQRIIRKIEENIDGLGEIKDFLSEISDPKGRFPEKVDEEIEESIDYLKKLGNKLRTSR